MIVITPIDWFWYFVVSFYT